MQQQQRLIPMQRTVVSNRMIGVSQQILQQGVVQQTVQQTRQLAPPPPYPGPPPPYPGQHQVIYYAYNIINNFYSVIVVQLFFVIPSVISPILHLDILFSRLPEK